MSAFPVRRFDPDRLDEIVAADIADLQNSVVADVLDPGEVARLSDMVDAALEADRALTPPHRSVDVGRVLFPPVHDPRFLDVLANEAVMGPCDRLLGSDCHIYMMTTLCQPPGSAGRPVHVDTPFDTPDYLVGVGVMVLLDDFTPESGPTRLDTVATVDRPSEEEYLARAMTLEAPAGSVCWYHPRLWHDALPNRSDRWRRAIAVGVVRPWVRQRFDMVRMLRHLDLAHLPRPVRRRLGFESIPPGSYEEFFLPDGVRAQELLNRAIARARDEEP
ncbi:MAG: phytanoyl-CoA dioxygenase family protein [Microthrixaceae bacterium]